MINVDGYLFEDEQTAELARKEEEGIRFIKERTPLENPEVVFRLYKKLLEQNLFVTPVGIRFLTKLQDILLASAGIANDEIPPIPVKNAVVIRKNEEHTAKEEQEKKEEKKKDEKKGKKGVDYRRPFLVSTFFAIILGVSVIGMFVINAISGNNVNIINYREQILNEYSGWEAELKEEEERLNQWEEELEQREEQLREQ